MGRALVTKCTVSYCQGNVVFAIHFIKMKHFSFKSGRAMWVAKLIKEDWPILCYSLEFGIKPGVAIQRNYICIRDGRY